MPWIDGQHLPYDGWYGGRVDMMIANGTYADFRAKIVRRVEKGFYSNKGSLEDKVLESKKKLEQWDAAWEAVPVDERIRRRDRVADDVEVKEKIFYTARGPVRAFRAKPSNNNNMGPKQKNGTEGRRRKLPAGFVTKSNGAASVSIGSSHAQGNTEATNPGAMPKSV